MKRKKYPPTQQGQLLVRITTKGEKRQIPKKITKAQLQVPFRENDLLTTDAFIRYCSDYGIETDKDDLEYLEKEDLLLPAVRVHPGVFKYRMLRVKGDKAGGWRHVPEQDFAEFKANHKIEEIRKGKFYDSVSISTGEEGWLEPYKKHRMVIYPARRKFRPWKDYGQMQFQVTDYSKVAKVWVAFYSHLQMYLLPLIQR